MKSGPFSILRKGPSCRLMVRVRVSKQFHQLGFRTPKPGATQQYITLLPRFRDHDPFTVCIANIQHAKRFREKSPRPTRGCGRAAVAQGNIGGCECTVWQVVMLRIQENAGPLLHQSA